MNRKKEILKLQSQFDALRLEFSAKLKENKDNTFKLKEKVSELETKLDRLRYDLRVFKETTILRELKRPDINNNEKHCLMKKLVELKNSQYFLSTDVTNESIEITLYKNEMGVLAPLQPEVCKITIPKEREVPTPSNGTPRRKRKNS